jgi:hypothetical protein
LTVCLEATLTTNRRKSYWDDETEISDGAGNTKEKSRGDGKEGDGKEGTIVYKSQQ